MSSDTDHITEIYSVGTFSGWRCKTCGKECRHVLPGYLTLRNARAHETKAKRLAERAGGES